MKKQMRNQYHPYVCAGLHILLEEDEDHLIFNEEHQLGVGSKAIDCLIIKKESDVQIKKDIGQLFLGHNLVEIKGYRDSLSIDGFYKAFGYGLFYKADTGSENSIDIKDITLTFICSRRPLKLLKHLKETWNVVYIKKWSGIYYLEGMIIPMQLIVASQLDPTEYLWLRSILLPLKTRQELQKIYTSYDQHRANNFYEKAMNFITKKDRKIIRRYGDMCEELQKLLWEMAGERAEKMAEEMAEQKAKEMAEEKAKEMAEEKAKEMVEEKEFKIVKNMLLKGLSCKEIGEYTGISIEEVQRIQKRIAC